MQNVIVLNADLKILNNLIRYTEVEGCRRIYRTAAFFMLFSDERRMRKRAVPYVDTI